MLVIKITESSLLRDILLGHPGEKDTHYISFLF